MNDRVVFTIAIPAYKDRYLKEALDSVLAQTYKNFEVVIVNDASPYNLDSIVNQYNDVRIHYYKNEKNCGAKNVVDNWNICLSYARGTYIICMGDDDKLHPDCLQYYLDLIKKYPNLDIYHIRTEIINDESGLVSVLEERPEWETVYSLMSTERVSFIGDWLFKTEMLKSRGGFYKLPYGWGSDYISSFLAAAGHGVANSNKIGYQYRGNPFSISSDLSCIEDKIMALYSYMRWRLDFIEKHPPKSETDYSLIEIIKANSVINTKRNIEDLIEFDIRRAILNRGIYWLRNLRKYKLSFISYLKCIFKAIKYRLFK